MRWLKPLVSLGLVLTAVGFALAIGLSNHQADYGRVPLPQGGPVHLPEGKVIIYFTVPGQSSNADQQATAPLSYQVTSLSGVPVPITAQNGAPADYAAVTRSETVGELGAIGKLDVPASGEYLVSASTGLAPNSASLEFGTNAGAALLAKWHLFAGLLLAAFLIALIPVPRHRRNWEDGVGPPTGWSSDPRAPYVG
jgi:hypothetical protein